MQLMYQNSISVKFDKYLNVSLINNGSGHEMVFGQGSGGERRRIDLAVMLGFRQIMKLTTGKDINVVYFDEVAENLDDEGVYRLHEAILDISKNSHVYVISHNPTLSQLLQSVTTLNVVKQGGCMKIAV
jgi:DNA repair exonuclease SbcCD ATPase subunit